MRWLTTAAAFSTLAMATKLTIDRNFGRLGETVEDARRTEMFTWFHLVETGREQHGYGVIVRFQPSGPKFHDVAMVSLEVESGGIKAATLRLSRAFIDGPDEAFARDIAVSFLGNALTTEDRSRADHLIRQIANDYRGQRPLIVHGSADREVPQPLTPAYEVFLGHGVDASWPLAHMDLHLINTHSGGDHLLIRVDLTRPARQASSCGSRGR
jgi:hypothetical protein